jgi:hypothetical protein
VSEGEEATIRTLTAYLEVMAILIPQHWGRVEGRGRLYADEEIEKSGARLTWRLRGAP